MHGEGIFSWRVLNLQNWGLSHSKLLKKSLLALESYGEIGALDEQINYFDTTLR